MPADDRSGSRVHRPRRPFSAHDLATIGFASGCALVTLALSRHFGNRDFDVFYASVRNIAGGGDPYAGIGALNTNPPHMVVMMAPLSHLSLGVAYWFWTILSAAAIAGAVFLVRRARGTPMTLAAVAAFLGYVGTFLQLAGGQVAWLLALPMTAAWLSGSTIAAGALLGLCASVKPFLFLFLPYFLWRRDWRVLCGVGAGVGAAVLVGVSLLGSQSYVSWFAALAQLNTAFHYSNGSLYGIVARLAQPDGLLLITSEFSRGLWLAGSAVVAAFTILALRSGLGRDRGWALVVVTAMVISPLGQPYYLALAIGPLWVTLRDLRWPNWGWGVLGLFWWPNVFTSPGPPTALWRLVFYNLCALGLVSLWAVLGFGKRKVSETLPLCPAD